ncbi:SGNH/GDSL hydrolase family protein [Aeromicrobium choanae]|uniref:SGNH/GDSL hydrolase family protein n=1 Tax=Aeromicrobium choanae TaxID=1736691 RepID=UPI00155FA971|nr:GDSL-type esterase/lipase family protein [Aeromicrobium choanae]
MHLVPLGRVAAALALATTALTACSTAPVPPASDTGPQYLAIGDSYASGFRPALDGEPAQNTTSGFAWKIARDRGLELVNVSCAGITAVDFLEGEACDEARRGADAPPVTGGSGAEEMTRHLDRYGDEIELVTVVLGLNDLRRCSLDSALRACAQETVPATTEAIDELLTLIRDRVGEDVPILGLTYPDFWTGEPVLQPEAESAPAIADATVDLFRRILNPALRAVYAKHGATFVDVTREFGAYGPSARTVETPEFGTLPARAEDVCRWTYFCALGDPHPTSAGHTEIARIVQEALDG